MKQRPPQERFKAGDIVRYADGISALFRYDGTHNCDRLYGDHVMGGVGSGCDMIFFDLRPASAEDLAFCRERRPEWFSLKGSPSMSSEREPLCGTTPAAMADYLRSCGSDTGDAIAAEIEAQVSAIELAYGLLWQVPVDRNNVDGLRISNARRALLLRLDRDGQARGIAAARDALAGESRKNSPTTWDDVRNALETLGKTIRG